LFSAQRPIILLLHSYVRLETSSIPVFFFFFFTDFFQSISGDYIFCYIFLFFSEIRLLEFYDMPDFEFVEGRFYV